MRFDPVQLKCNDSPVEEATAMDSRESFEKTAIRPWECLVAGKDLVAPQYWLFVGICAVAMLLGGMAPLGVLMGPMLCGMYLCYLTRMRGESVEFALLFKGFDYFLESFLATLLILGITMLVCMPLVVVVIVGMFCLITATAVTSGAAGQGSSDPSPAIALGIVGVVVAVLLAFIILAMLVGILLMFAYPLIVDRKLKAIPALRTSARAAWTNLGGLLLLALLLALIGTVSALLLYLPVFLVMPISFGAIATAYRKIFPELAPQMPPPVPQSSPAT
jgi:uncharacterized membrane protein